MRCGQTFVSYYNQKKVVEEKYFSKAFLPYLFRVIDRKFIITHNLTPNPDVKPGQEITAINCIAVKTIVDSFLTVSKADGNNGLNKKLDNISLYPPDMMIRGFLVALAVITIEFCLSSLFLQSCSQQETETVQELLANPDKIILVFANSNLLTQFYDITQTKTTSLGGNSLV